MSFLCTGKGHRHELRDSSVCISADWSSTVFTGWTPTWEQKWKLPHECTYNWTFQSVMVHCAEQLWCSPFEKIAWKLVQKHWQDRIPAPSDKNIKQWAELATLLKGEIHLIEWNVNSKVSWTRDPSHSWMKTGNATEHQDNESWFEP